MYGNNEIKAIGVTGQKKTAKYFANPSGFLYITNFPGV